MQREIMHPLLRDIAALLIGCTLITVQHIYWKANLVADWIAVYVVKHLGNFTWNDMEEALS